MLRNSSRYVKRNDNNDDILYSFKFLRSGMFVIEVINHVIVAVLPEIRVFHLTCCTMALFYLQFVNGTDNRQDSVAGCWFVLFSTYFWQVLVIWKL